jgi:hypothetical protein
VNPYKTLQVDPEADVEVIQAAYKRLARRYHPDSAEQPDAAAFQRVVEAWELLGDPARRAAWDADHPRATSSTRATPPPAWGSAPAWTHAPPPDRSSGDSTLPFDPNDLPPPRRRVRFGGPFLFLGPFALAVMAIGAVCMARLPTAPPTRSQAIAAPTAADLARCRADQARAEARAQERPRSDAIETLNDTARRCDRLEDQLGRSKSPRPNRLPSTPPAPPTDPPPAPPPTGPGNKPAPDAPT